MVLNRFDETKLLSKEDCYSLLQDEHFSGKDYQHVKKVWSKFEMKAMGNYHDLYLKTMLCCLQKSLKSLEMSP